MSSERERERDHDLTICLLTAHRLGYARTTLESTLRNVKYSRGLVHIHIADDGSGKEYREELYQLARAAGCGGFSKGSITKSDSMKRGYGANYNLATQIMHGSSQYILPLEDDWELLRELDLDPLTLALDAMGGVGGCIRLGYIGWTQTLGGKFVEHARQKFLLFDSTSHEPHVFAGGPRLETVAWERRLGPWPEGLSPGDTEFAIATGNPNSRVDVLWPLDLIRTWGDLFVHIGTERSY